MLRQINVYNNDSLIDAIFISDALHTELASILKTFDKASCNLAFLQEMQVRILSVCSRKINSLDPDTVFKVASDSLEWFDNLVALIDYIQHKLPSPYSLSLFLS